MSLTRRLAVALVRKLLPEVVADNPGTALALRSDGSQMMRPASRSSLACEPATIYAPPSYPSQMMHAPPPQPPQIYYAPPPPPRRRTRKITVTETITRYRG